jgi:hypothetical protein
MILVKLIGGLGNQMFEYALGRRLSLERKTELRFDLSWYNSSPDRRYTLDNFNISGKPASGFEKIKSRFSKRVKEPSFSYDAKVLSAPKNVSLDGYWLSPKYFDGIEDVLRKDFTLTAPQGEKFDRRLTEIKAVNSVSLHVRRGDYIAAKNRKVYAECTEEYYRNAVTYVKKHVNDIHIFVFSDDTAWVKDNLKIDAPVTFVSDEQFTDAQELMLMSVCKHNIIANSTFSWWGAWLNQNPEKIVITIKNWFVDPKLSDNDIIPDTWIRL